MTTTKRQNFNITPEQEAEIAQLKELIDASTVKEAVLAAIRLYTVIAREVKEGHQIYLAEGGAAPVKKLVIPELEALRPPRYKFLVGRPHEWRRQLYVKGRRLPAASVFKDYRLEGRTAEQLADDWDLPLEAVHECISYCQDHQALLQMEADEDLRRLMDSGISIDSPPLA
jgi:uncharacterized protein (DUF433 family)